MEGLLGQLGIDWKLFLSQAINFFILLIILRAFVYKPLLAAIKKRNEKIKEGLEKAKEADIRLREVDVISKGKIKDAEIEAINLIKKTEEKAKVMEQTFQKDSEKKQQEMLLKIQQDYQKQKEESQRQVSKEAAELVKKFISKTVQLKPGAIDEALIEKAVSEVKKNEPR